MAVVTPRFAIEDHGVPKNFEDPTLSPLAKALAKRVAKPHERWLEIAKWGSQALGRDPDKLTIKEALAVECYYTLHKKVTWPLWSTRMSDLDVESLVYAIQATHSRIKRLVPNVFDVDPGLLPGQTA